MSFLDEILKTTNDSKTVDDNGFLEYDWTTFLNPKNWGVEDYSGKESFDDAFSSARNDKKKEFLYKGERYNTRQATDLPKSNSEKQTKELFENYPELLEYTNKFDPVKIHWDSAGTRASYYRDDFYTANPFYSNVNSQSFIQLDSTLYPKETAQDFVAELAHHRQMANDRATNPEKYLEQHFGLLSSTKEREKYGEKVYDIPNTTEWRAHRIDEPAIQLDIMLSEQKKRELQESLGVTVDGIVGKETYRALVDSVRTDKVGHDKFQHANKLNIQKIDSGKQYANYRAMENEDQLLYLADKKYNLGLYKK